jgi:hypothetical protein
MHGGGGVFVLQIPHAVGRRKHGFGTGNVRGRPALHLVTAGQEQAKRNVGVAGTEGKHPLGSEGVKAAGAARIKNATANAVKGGDGGVQLLCQGGKMLGGYLTVAGEGTAANFHSAPLLFKSSSLSL